MSKQDSNGVRTPQDIERKYNFSKMLGLTKNYEIMEKGLTKIENELTDMLNAFMINLKDVLDNQSEISLWFYYGIPSLENEPYISWSNIDEHNGDIYYDKNTGYVYQFKKIEEKYLWELNVNPDLIEAMALTNSEIDTVDDHERKIFFSTPYTPYVNGDWWIKEDGSLYICQLSKPVDEEYEEQDFIISSSYVDTVSEKIGDTIKVLKGTVTKISDNFVQFTDLATGGSTTIAGENIKTGSIQSNNYKENQIGTKIDLSNGSIDSKNFKVDENGVIAALKGLIGNFEIRDGVLIGESYPRKTKWVNGEIIVTDYPKDYSQADIDYYFKIITPTQQDLDYYDFNEDGKIDLNDLTKLQSIVAMNMTKENPGHLVINNTDSQSLITLYDKDNNERMKLSSDSLNLLSSAGNLLKIGANDVIVNASNYINKLTIQDNIVDGQFVGLNAIVESNKYGKKIFEFNGKIS